MRAWWWRCALVVFFLGPLAPAAPAQAPQDGALLHDIRQAIGNVFTEEEVCDRFVERFERAGVQRDPLLLGYQGAVRMARGRHAFDPLSRLVHFNGGKAMLEKAIASDRSNTELRFLRLTIQVNVPAFLGYDGNKAEDLALVEGRLHEVKDPVVRDRIVRFIAASRASGKL
ncbi:MAG: hypothetical protein IT228_07245 [Flavobacteriales bacterium]|nr:hypothetical protein [Flavobacteriales bacterium]NUQ16688.1 hypothetical protein [Flavobacteriales bacterium]